MNDNLDNTFQCCVNNAPIMNNVMQNAPIIINKDINNAPMMNK